MDSSDRRSDSGVAGSPAAGDAATDERYSRQILFAGIGAEGQRKLAAGHAAIVGVGATGAAAANLLARAGVGRLTLIDRDFVEPSNLQRQTLFDEDDAREALPKAEAARRHLKQINSEVVVEAHVADLVPSNIDELLGDAQIVLDGTDNFETRFLVNDFAVANGKPWIYTAALGAYAATMNILPDSASEAEGPGSRVQGPEGRVQGPGARGQKIGNDSFVNGSFADDADVLPSGRWALDAGPSSCLACMFPSAPIGDVETCDTAGILATAVNLAASLQVTEALKFLTEQPHLMRRTLLAFDLWTGDRSEINAAAPRAGCEVCGQRVFRHLAGEARPHITLCGRNSVQIHEHARPLDLAALEQRLRPLGTVRANAMLLRFSHGAHTLTVFPDGRALIQGTTDKSLARSLYARFIGA